MGIKKTFSSFLLALVFCNSVFPTSVMAMQASRAAPTPGWFSWAVQGARSAVRGIAGKIGGPDGIFTEAQQEALTYPQLATHVDDQLSVRIPSEGSDSSQSGTIHDSPRDNVSEEPEQNANAQCDAQNPSCWHKVRSAWQKIPKKKVVSAAVAAVLAEFSAEAMQLVLAYELSDMDMSLFGFEKLYDDDGNEYGAEYNDVLGGKLSPACFAMVLVPLTWEFAKILNSFSFKLPAKNHPIARKMSLAVESLYAVANTTSYMQILAAITYVDAMIKYGHNPIGTLYFPLFVRIAPAYFLSNFFSAQASGANLTKRVFNKFSVTDKDEQGKARSALIKALRARASNLDALSVRELADLWQQVHPTETTLSEFERATEQTCVLTAGMKDAEVTQTQEPRLRKALGYTGMLIGAGAGVGIFFSAKSVAKGAAETYGLDEGAQELCGNSFAAVVVALSVPVKILAERGNLFRLYDAFSGYREDELKIKSFKRARQAMAVQNQLAGWIMAFPKITTAVVPFNGGVGFPERAPVWQNIGLTTTLGLAEGAVFSNGFNTKYEEMFEELILKISNPDATGRLAKWRRNPELMRDALRVTIKQLIAVIEQLPNEDVINLGVIAGLMDEYAMC